ncbi:MAG: alanine--glyoxylate aminotransferase family protein [Acidobacteriota bacterium]|jgi:aspartate aminotransferase-like enzyme
MSDDKDLHLFIPGPAGSTPEVVAATGHPIVPHYGPAFVAAYNHCIDLMKVVFQTENDLFLIVGPGTASLDAAFSSALPDGARVLAPSSGWFGNRLAEMCRAQRAQVDLVEYPLGEVIDVDDVRRRLAAADQSYDAVVWVHHETSSGVLNPVQELAAVAHEHGALTIIDAVSSLGGVDLQVDAWGVDLCASVANKCLAAPPGISAITVSPRAWEAIDANPSRRGWYLDLRTWRRYRENWAAWHPYPTTVASNVIEAITTSLEQILAEGLDVRIRRTAEAAAAVRGGLREMGFEMFVREDIASPVTTSVHGHPQLPPGDLIKYLRERSIYISGGLDDLAGKIFRIGHMGRSIDRSEVELLLGEIGNALRDAGVTVPEGEALHDIWA